MWAIEGLWSASLWARGRPFLYKLYKRDGKTVKSAGAGLKIEHPLTYTMAQQMAVDVKYLWWGNAYALRLFVATPGSKLMWMVKRLDASAFSNRTNSAYSAKPISVATLELGNPVCCQPMKHYRWQLQKMSWGSGFPQAITCKTSHNAVYLTDLLNIAGSYVSHMNV